MQDIYNYIPEKNHLSWVYSAAAILIIINITMGWSKSLCTWRLQYKLNVFEQFPHSWWVEDGHHRIHSEFRPCHTEHGLREHSSACQ